MSADFMAPSANRKLPQVDNSREAATNAPTATRASRNPTLIRLTPASVSSATPYGVPGMPARTLTGLPTAAQTVRMAPRSQRPERTARPRRPLRRPAIS